MLRSHLIRFVIAPCVVAVIGLSGCGSKVNDDGENSTSSTDSVQTTLTAKDAAVINAYRQFWDSYLAAANPMNPNDPALAQHATDDELSQVRNTFLSRQSAGQDIRGTIDLAPHVTTSSETQATIVDCYFDHTQHFVTATNTPADSVDTERQSVTASMIFVDGTWKVQAIRHEGTGCTATP